MANPEWIGVDLDGTLAEYYGWRGIDHIGAPIPLMVERVKRWIDSGKEVKIFTARISNPDEKLAATTAIWKWLFENGLPLLEITNIKDWKMLELWDDRCVQVQMNTGIILDKSTRELT